MTQRVILAVDEGTTNSKAILVNETGTIIASAAEALDVQFPKPGWVEQDAVHIWTKTIAAITKCLSLAEDTEVVALGISNQRESILLWDRITGKALGPVISWQCRRTTEACEALKAAGHQADILARTGLPLDPLFPAAKIKWLLEEHGADKNPKDICIGTVDSWLIWNFSGGLVHATDSSNAARTQLFNLKEMRWDEHLSEMFNAKLEMLPAVRDSSHIFGVTKSVGGLDDGIPIASAIGDSHAALFGHGAFQTGDGKITFGTGSSVMTTIPNFVDPPKGLTTTVAWSLEGNPTFAFEGNILVSASILPWTADILGLSSVSELIELAKTVDSSLGVDLVPAHVGLGAPHWNADARGLISGLTFNTNRSHIARAAVESVALQVQDVFAIMRANSPSGIARLFVDGGPSQNRFIMSMVADFLDHSVICSENTEASALGAAYLAGLAVGFWKDLATIEALKGDRETLKPSLDPKIRDESLDAWHKAIARSTLPT